MSESYILKNNRFEVHKTIPVPGRTDLIIYEVIRIIGGYPLFFEDHLKRLHHSLTKVNKPITIDNNGLLLQVYELCRKNKTTDGNIMIQVVFIDHRYDFLVFFIAHQYPSAIDYLNGVELGFLEVERNNPEIKAVNQNVRDASNREMVKNGWFEVLLVDHTKCIREGSRTNFFAIKDGVLITTPLEFVLKGITLLKVLQIAAEEGIPVNFSFLSISEIAHCDALFLTGTSPKILPVAKAGGVHFDVELPLLRTIMECYERYVLDDINKKRDTV